MGIEPTPRLFGRGTGFEVRQAHQHPSAPTFIIDQALFRRYVKFLFFGDKLRKVHAMRETFDRKIIYLDNAATSWPKPEAVYEAVDHAMRYSGNASRSGHRLALEADRLLYQTRKLLASFFNVQDPAQVVFTKNCTEALNVALKGLLKVGDHVITTSMEHNSVLRPLSRLQRSGVEVTVLQASKEGYVTPKQVAEAIRGNTKLIAVTHASNVVGTIMPIADIGKVAHDHGVLFLVDAAQTAGVLPIDMEQCFIDVLCVPGHKSLMGPSGTGALLVREGIVVEPLIEGGTGSLSESIEQPSFMPDRLESGTLNVVGIAGLKAGLEFIMGEGLSNIRQHELKLTNMLLEGLSELDNVTVYGPKDVERMVGVVSAVVKGVDPARVSALLDQEYGIATRPGLHCAPLAHKSIGTFETGTVRFSVGFFNTLEDIEETIRAMKHIVKEYG